MPILCHSLAISYGRTLQCSGRLAPLLQLANKVSRRLMIINSLFFIYSTLYLECNSGIWCFLERQLAFLGTVTGLHRVILELQAGHVLLTRPDPLSVWPYPTHQKLRRSRPDPQGCWPDQLRNLTGLDPTWSDQQGSIKGYWPDNKAPMWPCQLVKSLPAILKSDRSNQLQK